MPVDMNRYPKNWRQISNAIKERACHRCECVGECGLHPGKRCEEYDGFEAKYAKGSVVLTVAHLGVEKPDGSPGDPHDKMDCRDENLKAMCQRCHLRYDNEEHIKNRFRNLRRNKEAAGQAVLL